MIKKILFLLSFGFVLTAFKPNADIIVYPIPAGEPVSKDFSVTANGQQVPVYIAKVAPLEKKLRFKAMDDKVNSGKYFDEAAFAYFDLRKEAKINIVTNSEVKSVKILPSSAGVKATIKKGRIEFKIKTGQQLTVEVNGEIIRSLHIFANQIDSNRPDPNDSNVVYYGPGIHHVSRLILRSNQTLYLAGGAVLKTIVSEQESEGANPITGLQSQSYHPSISLVGNNIKVRGRGIIDASMCPTHARNMIMVQGSDISIEGVILRDASLWTIPIRMSNNVRIDNLKLIGYRANSDGIDICNSTNVLVENCFIRTLDDLIVIKTLKDSGVCKDIVVRKNILWNEVAHALSVGAEIREDISNVLFTDCDILHDLGREWVLRIYHCDAARVSNIRFENIRIEESSKLISLWIDKGFWSADSTRGYIDKVIFRDITAQGNPATIKLEGFGESNKISNVVFGNVTVNGSKLTDGQISKNNYVENLTIEK